MSGHTRGPWVVCERRIPHYLGGEHVELSIRTEWIDGQLKDQYPIACGAVGVPETKGDKPIHFVHIKPADASLIAAAPELLESVRDLLTCMDLAGWSGDAMAEKARAAVRKATGAA